MDSGHSLSSDSIDPTEMDSIAGSSQVEIVELRKNRIKSRENLSQLTNNSVNKNSVRLMRPETGHEDLNEDCVVYLRNGKQIRFTTQMLEQLIFRSFCIQNSIHSNESLNSSASKRKYKSSSTVRKSLPLQRLSLLRRRKRQRSRSQSRARSKSQRGWMELDATIDLIDDAPSPAPKPHIAKPRVIEVVDLADDSHDENVENEPHPPSRKPGKSGERDSLNESFKGKPWECPICFEPSKGQEIVATQCGHVFCRGCIEQHRSSGSNAKCPSCRFQLSRSKLITLFNM